MIKINGLVKTYSSDFSLEIDELTIEKGERVALIGANGSGKTTLLRLIFGAVKPDKGTVEISCPKDKIGYEPQNAFSFRGTVDKNVKMGVHPPDRYDEIITACKLNDIVNKHASRLSGGQRQRMCFARMMVGNYSLLLLDEPFSAMDVDFSRYFSEYLKAECERRGTTLLFSTHLPSQAKLTATKALMLHSGRVSSYSDISLLSNPADPFAKHFIEQWSIN